MQQLTPSKVDKMYIYKFAPNYLKKKLHNQSREKSWQNGTNGITRVSSSWHPLLFDCRGWLSNQVKNTGTWKQHHEQVLVQNNFFHLVLLDYELEATD